MHLQKIILRYVVFCLYIIRDFKFHDALSIMYVLCLYANISQKNK